MNYSTKVFLGLSTMYVIGLMIGYTICHVSASKPSSKTYVEAYKQGQIDCIEGRLIYQPDTLTNYIKIEP